jgi:hypothetical protein
MMVSSEAILPFFSNCKKLSIKGKIIYGMVSGNI